jgi:hypothetical protein
MLDFFPKRAHPATLANSGSFIRASWVVMRLVKGAARRTQYPNLSIPNIHLLISLFHQTGGCLTSCA